MEDALSKLTPQQKQEIMIRAQREVNTKLMQDMVESMSTLCFKKCAGSVGDRLDSREQGKKE